MFTSAATEREGSGRENIGYDSGLYITVESHYKGTQ